MITPIFVKKIIQIVGEIWQFFDLSKWPPSAILDFQI